MTSIRSRMSHRLTRDRVTLEIRRARKPFVVLVAMTVIAIASLSYLVGNLRSSMPWEDPYRVRVAVDDAKGVFPGKQEVRISGVAVGQITKADLVAGHPVLEVEIDRPHAPLYRDARVRLRPRTPLNDLFLDVERRGHVNAGKLKDGQTLQAQRTTTPVDIGRVANIFDADTRPRVKQAIDELGRGLGDHGHQLRATLIELAPFLRAAQRITGELAVRRGHTRRLVHNFRLMTEELGRREGQLAKLVSGGAASLTELGRNDASLGQTISQLPPTMRQLQSAFAAVRAAADELDPALDALRPSVYALPSGLAALRRLTLDARPAVTALRRPVQRLAPFVGHLRPTAVDLDRAFADLLPQAPRLDRITAKVTPCELALQKFFHNTISVTKFHTGRMAFPRGQLVGGASLLGGQINDPAQQASPSCAPGGPRK
jgi:virulence factor Mce-like protein